MEKQRILEEIERYWKDQWQDAAGNADRQREVERQLVQVRFLPRREHRDPGDIIVPSCLVELESSLADRVIHSWCYVIPSGGGLVLSVDGKPVQVVTPHSPLGGALLGKSRGEEVTIPAGSGTRRLKIRDFC